ncbi:hypothetical protein DFH09DRAFT_1072846 [Mycena vulgaris]|nr:hypothetical protein DFH09DRAFT_1072846 [Mycena vulgaris]
MEIIGGRPFRTAYDFVLGEVIFCDHGDTIIDAAAMSRKSDPATAAGKARPCLVVGILRKSEKLRLAPFTHMPPENTSSPGWEPVWTNPIINYPSVQIWVGRPSLTDMIFNEPLSMYHGQKPAYHTPPLTTTNMGSYLLRRNACLAFYTSTKDPDDRVWNGVAGEEVPDISSDEDDDEEDANPYTGSYFRNPSSSRTVRGGLAAGSRNDNSFLLPGLSYAANVTQGYNMGSSQYRQPAPGQGGSNLQTTRPRRTAPRRTANVGFPQLQIGPWRTSDPKFKAPSISISDTTQFPALGGNTYPSTHRAPAQSGARRTQPPANSQYPSTGFDPQVAALNHPIYASTVPGPLNPNGGPSSPWPGYNPQSAPNVVQRSYPWNMAAPGSSSVQAGPSLGPAVAGYQNAALALWQQQQQAAITRQQATTAQYPPTGYNTQSPAANNPAWGTSNQTHWSYGRPHRRA